jgi:hypothetical protein
MATGLNAQTATSVGAGGVIVVPTACDITGNSFVQEGRTLLRLVNTDATSKTVTFTFPVLVDGNTVPAEVLTLAASEVRYVAAGLGQYKNLYPGGLVSFTANSILMKYELVNFAG